MRLEGSIRAFSLLLAALFAAAANAGAAFGESREQVAHRLKEHPECCVIDARGAVARMRSAIPFAVVMGPTVRVKRGAFALLVADNDDSAMKSAREVAGRSEGDVVAVRGGYATLSALGLGGPGATSATPSRFVIPSNTCEQGPALQEFKH